MVSSAIPRADPDAAAGAGAEPPLVSIVIPVFRGDPYLREAIDSALAQTWPALEVIVVDDGSDDDGATRRIAESYGDRIRLIVKENGGVSTALNAGIAAMRGRYFSWLSHDDRYDPRKVERQMAAMRAEAEDVVVFSDYDVIDPHGRFHRRIHATRGYDPAHPIWAILEGRISGCTLLIPRACFTACGTFDAGLPGTQDYELWFHMARRYRFVGIAEPLVQSREHPGQVSRQRRQTDEVVLLWLAMLDRLSVDEMVAAAGSETRFLVRVLRHIGPLVMPVAVLALERRLRRSLADLAVALVWVGEDGGGVAAAIDAVEQAGPTVTTLVRLDPGQAAETAIGLRALRAPRPLLVLRADRRGAMATVLQVPDVVTEPLILVASPRCRLSGESLRPVVEALAMDEAEGCLIPGDAAGLRPGGLSPGLDGLLILSDALRRTARGGDAEDDWAAALAAATRLTVMAPPTVPPPPAVAAPGPRRFGLSRPAVPGRDTLLIIVHDLGGGAHRYAGRVADLARRRVDVLFAWGIDNRSLAISAAAPGAAELAFDLPAELDAAVALLRRRRVVRVDAMQTMGLDDFLLPLVDRLDVPLDVTLLDYYAVAHSPHLMDDRGIYVGDAVLADPGHPLRRSAAVPALLGRAARRIAISRDTAARLAAMVPGLPFIAARLPEAHRPQSFRVHPPAREKGEPMRVLVLGQFAPHKGSALVLEVARRAREAGAPLSFHILGNIPVVPDAAAQLNLHVYGGYRQAQLTELVCAIRPHLAWMPFSVPETHSFALSDVMLQGLPILTVALGAIAERVEGRPRTWVLDPRSAHATMHLQWLERLAHERLETPPLWQPTGYLPPLAERFYEDAYLAPLGR